MAKQQAALALPRAYPWNTAYQPHKVKAEAGGGVSKTIPDRTMSMREILSRFAKGLPLDSNKVPIYHGEDNEVPDFATMDLVEQQEYMDEVKENVKQIQENLRKQEDEKKKRRSSPPVSHPDPMSPAGSDPGPAKPGQGRQDAKPETGGAQPGI